jgi:hypothetical protein
MAAPHIRGNPSDFVTVVEISVWICFTKSVDVCFNCSEKNTCLTPLRKCNTYCPLFWMYFTRSHHRKLNRRTNILHITTGTSCFQFIYWLLPNAINMDILYGGQIIISAIKPADTISKYRYTRTAWPELLRASTKKIGDYSHRLRIHTAKHYSILIFKRVRKIAKSDYQLHRVRPHWTTRIQLDGFWWKLIFWAFFENLSRKFKFH